MAIPDILWHFSCAIDFLGLPGKDDKVMSRLQIPYTSVLVDPADYNSDRFESIIRN